MSTFGPYKATVVNVHDGDTIDVDIILSKLGAWRTGAHSGASTDIDLGFNMHRTSRGIVRESQSVRVYGCNAPELATPAGKLALAYMLTLLKPGDRVTLLSHGWDKYGGRIDGEVTLADGRDLARTLINGGYAAPWDGKGAKPVPA